MSSNSPDASTPVSPPPSTAASGDTGKYLSVSESNTPVGRWTLTNPSNSPMTLQQLAEITTLIKECTSFVDATKSSLAIPFAAFERVRQWRVKRRESKAMDAFDTLLPKIKSAEGALRFTITDTVERKSALREQAKFLLARLSSCIAYNQENLDRLLPVVEDTRAVVISLSDALVGVKRMISFNNELLRLRNVQNAGTRRGGNQYNYRGGNMAMFRPVSEDDLSRDAEHGPLLERLNVLRETRERFVNSLSLLLESREMYTVNHENCVKCFKQICDLLRLDKDPVLMSAPGSPKAKSVTSSASSFSTPLASNAAAAAQSTPVSATRRLSLAIQSVVAGVGSSVSSATSPADDDDPLDIVTTTKDEASGLGSIMIGKELIPVYPHRDTCTDCTCVVTITNDCIESFEEIHNVQVTATKQLSLLVEARERINEVMEGVLPNSVATVVDAGQYQLDEGKADAASTSDEASDPADASRPVDVQTSGSSESTTKNDAEEVYANSGGLSDDNRNITV